MGLAPQKVMEKNKMSCTVENRGKEKRRPQKLFPFHSLYLLYNLLNYTGYFSHTFSGSLIKIEKNVYSTFTVTRER